MSSGLLLGVPVADATYAQTNFQGGEWSQAYQGRVDDPDYKKALALCLNYIPTQEGSLLPRSGFKRLGNTKGNAPGKLMPFRFKSELPYVSEFTAGNLRFWGVGLPILDQVNYAKITSVAGTPPIFTLRLGTDNTAGIPEGWANGDSLLFQYSQTDDMEPNPYFANRELILTIESATTISLSDAVTGSPFTTAVTLGSNTCRLYKIIDLETPYQHPEGIRQVQITEQAVTNVAGTDAVSMSPPDHRVTYLYPLANPRSLSYEQTLSEGLISEQFIDGPYLDSTGTETPLWVSGTTGTIEVIFHQWSAVTRFNFGDLCLDYSTDPTDDPYYYVSLVNDNVGNVLPSGAPFVDTKWLRLNIQRKTWDAATAYGLGIAVTNAVYTGSAVPDVETPIYYSIQAANTAHIPASAPLWWSTTPPTYSALLAYPAGAVVVYLGDNYVATGVAAIGVTPAGAPWVLCPDLNAAADEITNIRTGWLNKPLFYTDDMGGDSHGFQLGNPGRLMRFKCAPQPWSSEFTYAANELVNFNDNIYKALTSSNIGNYPDIDATNWEIQAETIIWTWGRIVTSDQHQFVATVEILGRDLPTSNPVWEFRMGLYSDTTGWPTCGAYHEGRLCLGGVTANRADLGVSNQGYNFAPTAPDGTVADNNAIALTLNSAKSEQVESIASISEGIVLFTNEAEWLVSASALNDPLTPTSVQAHRATKWAAFPNDTAELPSAIAVVQKGGRRIFEYRTFVDTTSYQSRLNSVDITRRCQHLTIGGMGVVQYQNLPQPIIWACPQDFLIVDFAPSTHHICPLGITPPLIGQTQTEDVTLNPQATLFGFGYSRTPETSYCAPFSFEHALTLKNGPGTPQQINSIAVQRYWQEGVENLYATSMCPDDALFYVEMMMPLFEGEPLENILFDDGRVNFYGTKASAFMLDAALTPIGAKVSDDALSVTFYGMPTMAGEEVSFTILGKYVGDFTVAADGSVAVPFSAAFLAGDIKTACNDLNETLANDGTNTSSLPAYFQQFLFDANGSSVPSPSASTQIYAQFGYKFRRRGQMLKPQRSGRHRSAYRSASLSDQHHREPTAPESDQQRHVGGRQFNRPDAERAIRARRDQ
jgi:hypothetical protein